MHSVAFSDALARTHLWLWINFMNSNRRMRILEIALALACFPGLKLAQAQAGNTSTSPKQPISLKGLTAALEDGGASELDLVDQIKQRGVHFLFTKEAEEQLRSAKAPLTVVNAARDNFREDPVSAGVRELSSTMADAACKMPENQLSSAVIKVSQAIQTDPDNPAAYRCRAILYVQQKRYDDALQDMELVITAEPREYRSYYLRGAVYCNMEDYPLCVKDLNFYLDHTPQADAYDLRGQAYNAMKRYENAVDDYSDAIRIRPNDESFYIHRAISRNNAGDKNAALSDCNSALSIAPRNASYLHFRGDLKEGLGDHQGAVADWRAARQLGDTTVSEKAVQAVWICSLNKADYTVNADNNTVSVTPLRGGFRATLQVRKKGNKQTFQGRWTLNDTTAYIELTNLSGTEIDGYLFQPSSSAANCSTKTQAFFQNMSGVNDSNQPTCTRYDFSFVRKQ